MSTSTVIVRYDGAALGDHQMDVADLAPALLGISELCKIANQKFNGDRAAVKVMIGTDQEHQCFQFSIDVVQTIWQQAQAIIGDNEIKSAKDILEWVGIIGGGAVGGVAGLLKLLKWLKGRQITGTEMVVKDGQNVVQIKVAGNNNTVILAHPAAYDMLADPKAVASAKRIAEPLTKPGYEKVEFENTDGVKQEEISKEEAIEIVGMSPVISLEVDLESPQEITAWIKVYAPVYDPSSTQWRFQFGERHEFMDISDTNIAVDAIRRGGVLIDDSYKVKLQIQQTQTTSGNFKNKFKIKEVLEFRAARVPQQQSLLDKID